jgi:dihydroorotate dehydrogenase
VGSRLVLIGVGGVTTGEDAYRKIKAGASLVQLYTALVFNGGSLIPKIKRDLVKCLERDGFACVADAVGTDVK